MPRVESPRRLRVFSRTESRLQLAGARSAPAPEPRTREGFHSRRAPNSKRTESGRGNLHYRGLQEDHGGRKGV